MTSSDSSSVTLLSSLYLAPIEYYYALNRCNKAIIEINDNYQKQSYRNRCIIAGANGPLPLSIPIEKPKSTKSLMKDIRIAEHGNWRHLHWNALIRLTTRLLFFHIMRMTLDRFFKKRLIFFINFTKSFQNLFSSLQG